MAWFLLFDSSLSDKRAFHCIIGHFKGHLSPRSRRAQFAVILESRCSPNKREKSETVRLIKYILLFYFYSNLVSHFIFFI